MKNKANCVIIYEIVGEEYMKKEILGKCMLLMSALIWGSSFIVMKNAVDFISPFTLLCIRFVLSTIFISILFLIK